MGIRRYLFILIFFIFNVACDSEKFFSSHYSDLSGYDSTAISGYIYRKDTGKPIAGANILVDLNKSKTNDEGYFYLPVYYSQDLNRNLPAPVYIWAENFEPLLTSIQILPEPFDAGSFRLVWAVPIILSGTILVKEDETIIEAKVKDYQGAETIKGVEGRLYIRGRAVFFSMHEVLVVNENTSLWQSDRLPLVFDGPLAIFAEDVDGHRGSRSFPRTNF